MDLVRNKNKKKPLLIVIAGPTAIGKTSISVQLAQHYQTEILSADSRQCYKEMRIGTARPNREEQKGIPHHFIASHSIHDSLTAIDYEEYSLRALKSIFQKKPIAILCGGTGLYIKALIEGFDEMPDIDKDIEKEILQKYKDNGLEWLQKEIQIQDPLFPKDQALENPHRMLRALVFKNSTGKSIQEFRKGNKKERPFDTLFFAINTDREVLYDRINKRVDLMVKEGLIDEAKSLYPYRHLKNLDTVGYRELFLAFDGEITIQEAIEKIKQNTRKYAKRQITWLKREENVQWFSPEDLNKIINKVDEVLLR
ncbi:MAG TPA: tRNA (adenosine(37)-N6)-dimethylallyltransferase MiaA [Chitinophagaceae bacterium]|nr:tRNA (adenosine(37)-N6)-dimethylallyltransferase MiaA [Chitinophagaceae bacterium]